MKNNIICLFLVLLPLAVEAQWRIGGAVGLDYNTLSTVKEYNPDWEYKGKYGFSGCLMGQYDVSEWFGLRAELCYLQKNNVQLSNIFIIKDNVKIPLTTFSHFLHVPIMASFNYGKIVRLFLNVGLYGGYCMESNKTLMFLTNSILSTRDFCGKIKTNKTDYGPVGGIGFELRWHKRWSSQIEARYYHSLKSFNKVDTNVIDYSHYNSTCVFQLSTAFHL